jgi:hypothetical protein
MAGRFTPTYRAVPRRGNPEMMPVGLKNPKEFLSHVVDQDMSAFGAPGQAELRLGYHACTSLLSLRDWVYEDQKNNVWTFRGRTYPPIRSKTKFFQELCGIESDFKIISDIANATKHMVLDTSRRLTDLHGAANVHIQTIAGSGLLGDGALGGGAIGSISSARVLVHIGAGFHDVLQSATKVHNLWRELFVENHW